MLFATKYDRKRDAAEANTGEDLVERAGYIPADIRITNIMRAGMRLLEHRAEQYDFNDLAKLDLSFSDRTRSKNYDLADAFQDANALKKRLADQQKAAELAAKKEAETPPVAPVTE